MRLLVCTNYCCVVLRVLAAGSRTFTFGRNIVALTMYRHSCRFISEHNLAPKSGPYTYIVATQS